MAKRKTRQDERLENEAQYRTELGDTAPYFKAGDMVSYKLGKVAGTGKIQEVIIPNDDDNPEEAYPEYRIEGMRDTFYEVELTAYVMPVNEITSIAQESTGAIAEAQEQGIVPAVLPEALSAEEQDTLASCEAVIDATRRQFIAAGEALAKIRDGKLYRMQYASFEEYCEKKWGFSRIQGYRLMQASAVANTLEKAGLDAPDNEAIARNLTGLTDDQAQLVWRIVKETAPDGVVTASHVKSVVESLRTILATGTVEGADGEQIPVNQASVDVLKAGITQATHERMMRQITQITASTGWSRVANFTYDVFDQTALDAIITYLRDEGIGKANIKINVYQKD